MAKKGSITIYLCLMLSVFLLLFQVIYRSAGAGARTQLSVGIHQSLYSVFARYDPVLLGAVWAAVCGWKFWRRKIQAGFALRLYLPGDERRFCSGKRMEEEYLGTAHRSCGLTGYTLATDRKGEAFRLQAVEVMKKKPGEPGDTQPSRTCGRREGNS